MQFQITYCLLNSNNLVVAFGKILIIWHYRCCQAYFVIIFNVAMLPFATLLGEEYIFCCTNNLKRFFFHVLFSINCHSQTAAHIPTIFTALGTRDVPITRYRQFFGNQHR